MVGLAVGADGDRGFGSDPDRDELSYRLTVELLEADWGERRCLLPADFDSIPPGPFLEVILSGVDRSCLNGFDLVRVVRARERLIAHHQGEQATEMVEVAYSVPGDADADPGRSDESFEFASDEIRAALHLTRRAAENRLGLAMGLVERLPVVLQMLREGLVDMVRARVFLDGTSHLTDGAAGSVVDVLAGDAPGLTTGQLRARSAGVCITVDPDTAAVREQHAHAERRLWIEPTVDGTAHLHLFDIAVDEARAVGRRVNGLMFSHRKTGDTRSHDQLRADITVDLLLGSDPTHGGRGLVDVRVDLVTLAGLDERAAEIPGMGPVVAEVARRVADRQHRAEWRFVVTDTEGRIVDIVTPRRRPSAALSRHVQALHPKCSFPGCRVPAADCDFDHLTPWSDGGKTRTGNGGPKCRHDHQLKDHGWTHHHHDGQDIWTSPLGHTYISQGQSP